MTGAHATTVVAVQRGGTVAVAGDGQVTVGDIVMKARASKVRRLFHGQVVCGFAGAVADALTLFDKFEQHLDKHQGNLVRAAIGLSKEWRTDKYLRRLEAMLIVADANRILLLSGDGEVIEPDDGDGVGDLSGRTQHRAPGHRSPAWQAGTDPPASSLPPCE